MIQNRKILKKSKKTGFAIVFYHLKNMKTFWQIAAIAVVFGIAKSDDNCEGQVKEFEETLQNITVCNAGLKRMESDQKNLQLLIALKNGEYEALNCILKKTRQIA